MNPLHEAIGKLRRRLSVQQWVYLSVRSLVYSASLACVWLGVTRLFPRIGGVMAPALSLVVAGLCIAGVMAWIRRVSPVEAALAADQRLGLRERFTSSIELAEAQGPMIAALHADARAHLTRLNVAQDFPLCGPRSLRAVYIPLAVFGLAYLFLPEFDLFGFQERHVEAKAKIEKVKMQVDRLQREVKPLKEALKPGEAGALSDTVALVERIAEQLDRGAITEKQALAKLSDLRDSLKARHDALKQSNPVPKLAKNERFGTAQDIASAMRNNEMGKAAEKLRELQKKLEKGDLSEKEQAAIARDLAQLAKAIGMQNPALAEALNQAAQCLEGGKCSAALAALELAELSLEELAGLLEELDRLCKAGLCVDCMMRGMGRGGIGEWRPGEAEKFGNGMGGPGHGRGGGVGDLPDIDAGFEASLLPGPMTQGQILVSVEERAAPDQDAQSSIEYIQGAFVEARQEAELALEQEEIPRASREFVRQYFGTLETQPQGASPSSVESVP